MAEDKPEIVDAGDVDEVREEVIDVLARSAEVYGAKRSHGRLYGILYFADEPLSLDDLVEASGYAKSTVSSAMSTLERYYVVQRRSVEGEGKKAFYEAEDDFWYVFQQFLDQQIRREVRTTSRALEAAELVLEEADEEVVGTDLEKVRRLESVCDRLETVVDGVASRPPEQVIDLVAGAQPTDEA